MNSGMRARGYMGGVMAAVVLLAAAAVAFATGTQGATLSADEALKELMAGNARFVTCRTKDRLPTMKQTREKLVQGQKPYAVVLTCSDSRVPPEIVFDQTLGQIFVVRVAGNVADPAVVGSIEYAVEHLGTPLIMVLGHESCGAVTAALNATGKPEGNIGKIIADIAPAVSKAKGAAKAGNHEPLVERAIDNNIGLAADNLKARSAIIREMAGQGKVRIVKAKYHLHDGDVTIITP